MRYAGSQCVHSRCFVLRADSDSADRLEYQGDVERESGHRSQHYAKLRGRCAQSVAPREKVSDLVVHAGAFS